MKIAANEIVNFSWIAESSNYSLSFDVVIRNFFADEMDLATLRICIYPENSRDVSKEKVLFYDKLDLDWFYNLTDKSSDTDMIIESVKYILKSKKLEEILNYGNSSRNFKFKENIISILKEYLEYITG